MTVTAIIPAYNEERTLGNVLYAVKQVELIKRIIVVSDGSTDGTPDIAYSLGAEVVELSHNVGKGGAIKAGLDRCDEDDVVLFLDADLIGLRDDHVTALLMPVITGDADMSIGVFKNGRITTDLAQWIAPYLSGQRAVRKSVISSIPCMDVSRYGVEVAVTLYLKRNSARIRVVELQGMTHFMKEEKLGLIKGIKARIRMYWDIMKCLRF